MVCKYLCDKILPVVAEVELFLVITTNDSQELRWIKVIAPVTQIVGSSTAGTWNTLLCLACQYVVRSNQLHAKWW